MPDPAVKILDKPVTKAIATPKGTVTPESADSTHNHQHGKLKTHASAAGMKGIAALDTGPIRVNNNASTIANLMKILKKDNRDKKANAFPSLHSMPEIPILPECDSVFGVFVPWPIFEESDYVRATAYFGGTTDKTMLFLHGFNNTADAEDRCVYYSFDSKGRAIKKTTVVRVDANSSGKYQKKENWIDKDDIDEFYHDDPVRIKAINSGTTGASKTLAKATSGQYFPASEVELDVAREFLLLHQSKNSEIRAMAKGMILSHIRLMKINFGDMNSAKRFFEVLEVYNSSGSDGHLSAIQKAVKEKKASYFADTFDTNKIYMKGDKRPEVVGQAARLNYLMQGLTANPIKLDGRQRKIFMREVSSLNLDYAKAIRDNASRKDGFYGLKDGGKLPGIIVALGKAQFAAMAKAVKYERNLYAWKFSLKGFDFSKPGVKFDREKDAITWWYTGKKATTKTTSNMVPSGPDLKRVFNDSLERKFDMDYSPYLLNVKKLYTPGDATLTNGEIDSDKPGSIRHAVTARYSKYARADKEKKTNVFRLKINKIVKKLQTEKARLLVAKQGSARLREIDLVLNFVDKLRAKKLIGTMGPALLEAEPAKLKKPISLPLPVIKSAQRLLKAEMAKS